MNSRPDIHQQVICANVFIRKDGKYLLLKRSSLKRYAPNYLHPVGGKVDHGENPLEAALREAREESGVELKNIRLKAAILEIQPEKDEPYDWMIYHFVADYAGGEVLSTEEGELVLVDEAEIQAGDLFPSVRLLIDRLLDPSSPTVFATVEYGEGHLIIDATVSECA